MELSEHLTFEETPRHTEIPESVRTQPGSVAVRVTGNEDGSTITVMSADRVGLLADAAALLALQKISIRAARIWTEDGIGCSEWQVARTGLDQHLLRERLEGIVDGRLDVTGRLRVANAADLAPAVVVHAEASERATVIEVRAADRPGVVYLVCAALARLGLTVRSAHVDTLGPQAVDVFYVQEQQAVALTAERARQAADAIRAALTAPDGS